MKKNTYRLLALVMLLLSSIVSNNAAAQFNSNASFANQVLTLVNQQRTQRNLSPLKYNATLAGAAQGHSLAMASKNFFGHCNPDTKTRSVNRIRAAGYPPSTTGENIAAGQTTPGSVMAAWMASPGHRQNILNPNYTEMGVGYIFDVNDGSNVSNVNASCNRDGSTGGPYRHYWAQNFGGANTGTSSYSIGGSISGLATGKSVVLQNNNTEYKTFNSNGTFAFTTKIANNSSYSVKVATRPTGQKCTVTNASGAINGSHITNIRVSCVNNTPPPASSYKVGGQISGLASGKSVILQNNNTEFKTFNSNGIFAFATKIANGDSYSVKVATQPAGQKCTVTKASGIIKNSNITNIAVKCVDNSTSSANTPVMSGLSGSWYDPSYNGSGFNLIQTNKGGLLIYFYGYKGNGNGSSQWLLSDVIDDPVRKGQTITANIFSGFTGNGGKFTTKPTSPRSGLKQWGTITITINSCNSGTIALAGDDGTINHNIIPLAPINGLTCTETDTPNYVAPSSTTAVISGVSGSWYDPQYNGSGFNLVQTNNGGLLMYFYGYKGNADGAAQWLLSDVITDPVSSGQTITANVFSGFAGNGGTFTTKPASPRSGLQEWGTAKITVNSCNSGIIELTGDDGTITHNIVPITSIDGVKCTE